MNSINEPAGIAECAEFLRKYNEWRREPYDQLESKQPSPVDLGAHIDFAIEVLEAMAGHDHLMVISATRYCLGRMTYIVSDCVEWLVKTWPLLSESTRNIIKRDIEEAFTRDDEDREAGREYKALGHDCDRAEWEKVRALWVAK